jgi:hypothetical protein
MKVQIVTPYCVSHLQRYGVRYKVMLYMCTHPKSVGPDGIWFYYERLLHNICAAAKICFQS